MVRKRTFVPGSDEHLGRSVEATTARRSDDEAASSLYSLGLLAVALMASAIGFSFVS